jgi:formylglycine-generating enzyme required for sulfatase activity
VRRAFFIAALLLAAGCVRTPETRVDWVEIPGGRFMMGSDASSETAPRHEVTVKTFLMAKTPTTKAQYARCVAAGRCAAPPCRWPAAEGEGEHPVVCVSWDDARAYAKWAGGRLPSEAEWEYAARGAGGDRMFPWGDEAPTCARARVFGCGRGAVPVCSTPAGSTAQGLCDMIGEVWEWTEDGWHKSYLGAPADGGAWEPGGPTQVNRGGSWDYEGRVIRNVDRNQTGGVEHSDDLGFRPAKSR